MHVSTNFVRGEASSLHGGFFEVQNFDSPGTGGRQGRFGGRPSSGC